MDVSTTAYEWLEDAYIAGGYVEEGYLTQPLVNHGLLVKRSDDSEADTVNYGNLKFFSRDTHTIYPPKLEVCWDDSLWNIGSSTMTEISDLNNYKIYMERIRDSYRENSKVRFRINTRDRYHTATAKVGVTSKFTNYYLPSGSCYYSIKDANTEETIIPFDNYSKISADSNGNYFDFWMDTLQPERFYRIVFKVEKDDLVEYYDDHYVF